MPLPRQTTSRGDWTHKKLGRCDGGRSVSWLASFSRRKRCVRRRNGGSASTRRSVCAIAGAYRPRLTNDARLQRPDQSDMSSDAVGVEVGFLLNSNVELLGLLLYALEGRTLATNKRAHGLVRHRQKHGGFRFVQGVAESAPEKSKRCDLSRYLGNRRKMRRDAVRARGERPQPQWRSHIESPCWILAGFFGLGL